MGERTANASAKSSEMLEAEYTKMANVEADHWWYTSLHADILDMIVKHFGNNRHISILDAGCGTGGFLRCLHRHGYDNCVGLDISALAVDHCRKEGLNVLQGSIAEESVLARAGKVDLIVSLDVIYSLPGEAQRSDFFRAASEMLNEGGLMLVQTPAFACLRGIHDLAVGVNRRYTKQDMQTLLMQAGIVDFDLRYRLLLLTPLVFLARLLQRLRLKFGSKVVIASDTGMPPVFVNVMLFHLQRLEDRWLPFRPFGTSLQIVARK